MSLLSRLAVGAARAYGSLAISNRVSADYLVVAGGASGGGAQGGGGGAGGYKTNSVTLSTLTTYSITVGAGGAASAASVGANGNNGSNSVLSGTGITTVTSTGGGYGGGGEGASGGNGNSGGSGGGGGGDVSGGTSGGTGISGEGNNGGLSPNISPRPAGGGGGATSAGTAGSGSTGGAGGTGTASSISGSSVTYAGGGGAGGRSGITTAGNGGSGGGGNGSATTSGTAGTANTGGGGGGGGYTGTSYASGAGGSGIVIISYTSATPRFVGGTITTSGGKQIHTFTSSGTLSPITPITASYLVVAGGGGAGNDRAGGGGAGGLLTSSTTLYSGATYVVTVGAGGNAGTSGGAGSNGSNSVVSGTGLTTLTATGGGGSGGGSSVNGLSGGSGGGGAYNSGTGGTGTVGQGNNGGAGSNNFPQVGAGGGGGAGAAGSVGTTSAGGNGGIGVASSISGTSTYYAGGGGGGALGGTAATGGTGGGGNANPGSGTAGSAGTTNTGGGGGGGGGSNGNGGSGGSGIVIISYAGSQQFNGGLVTTSGGNTIHTFTSTGALTPLTNNLTNSLRFRSSASAYLSRTLSTPTNNKIFTYSVWVKRGALNGYYALFSPASSGTGYTTFRFESDDTINFQEYTGSAYNYQLDTTQVFRDPSAWYHLVVAVDTTQATAANRIKLYVNGNQVTAFATATYPTQNSNPFFNSAVGHNVGANIYSGSREQYFDGYMTDINFIDGQALEPYYFGNNDANGVWKPIQYKGTYGTNGFYLTFGNTTSTTTLGYDSSPNGNNWTCNNISLTAGVTYDAMTDVPTNTSATAANYATLNPLWINSNLTLAGANLNVTSSGNGGTAISTIAMESGKYYCEVTINTGSDATNIGIVNSSFNPSLSSPTLSGVNAVGYYGSSGVKFVNGTESSYGASYTTGDIIGIALDITAGTVTFYKNNTSQGAITHGLTGPFYFATSDVSSGSNINQSWNFGQRPFAYTPPTGYVALNTYNLPTPTILQGNRYFDATLYTGTRTTQTVVNSGQFKPDMVWCKGRSFVSQILVSDSVRGANKQVFTQLDIAEQTDSTMITSFNNNGFTMGDNSGGPYGNINYEIGGTHVAWQWAGNGGTTSSNTQGSITSTVQVNTTTGFSIVTYTGTGANATVGHGLGVAPKMVILKARSAAYGWNVWHTALSGTQYLNLFNTNAVGTAADAWNSTIPSSTVFSLGTNAGLNQNGVTFLVYCFAEIAGFSKFGSATGNGNADGVFVYTGFRPRFILWKKTSGVGDWRIWDTSRSTFNSAQKILYANASDAEYDPNNGTTNIDILSNGFKLRSSNLNESSATYIYACFAEHPFKNSNAR
jgi:hypothetical protein